MREGCWGAAAALWLAARADAARGRWKRRTLGSSFFFLIHFALFVLIQSLLCWLDDDTPAHCCAGAPSPTHTTSCTHHQHLRGVVCLNPGRLCKGKAGGTFARLVVHNDAAADEAAPLWERMWAQVVHI